MRTTVRTLLHDQNHHLHHHPHHYNHHPSFSSTLLEEICRSFDEEGDHPYQTQNNRMKKSSGTYLDRDNRFLVDQWMQSQKEKVNANPCDGNFRRSDHRRTVYSSSSTSSSDSSSGFGVFSFSDTESLYACSSKQKPPAAPLKPIRTGVNSAEFHRKSHFDEFPAAKKKKKKEGNLHQRALKLYGDLKKVKQPISPGGKLASFLNSLFSPRVYKKPNISSSSSSSPSPSLSSNGQKSERESAVTPSTASRSCLSKTPTSAGKFEKRSVRFVDDVGGILKTRGGDAAKCDSLKSVSDDEFRLCIGENKHRSVEEIALELLKKYRHRKELKVNIVTDCGRKFENDVNVGGFEDDEEEEEEGDDDSYCSSDLFELENLLDIGVVDRYDEELPVYETTRVDANRAIAIANGFIL